MTTSKPRPTIVHGEEHAYPVLPLRDIVVFPHNIVPLFVGREKSIRALEEVMKNDALVLLATQKNASDDDPAPEAIRSEEHTSELQSPMYLVCRLLLEKKKTNSNLYAR